MSNWQRVWIRVLPALLSCATLCSAGIGDVNGRDDGWFAGEEGRRIVDNVITWQNSSGGWWKGYDVNSARSRDHQPKVDPRWPSADQNVTGETGTFDNRATYTEVRVLARAFRVTKEPCYRQACERGLKFIFDAQYPNGGWPQRFPLEDNYGRHITFNDTAMVGVMTLLKEIAAGEKDFAWMDDVTRARAREAFDRGVECILNCQIKVGGALTGWCQQHDAQTLAPAEARSYELPSISGSESCEIVRLLMDLENPSQRVKESVRAAVEWLERSKITGKRLEKRRDASGANDVGVIDDPSAEALWARFYDIETNRPFFCGRDGVKKWSLDEIERERRVGYAWLRPWGASVLKEYPKWAAGGIEGTSRVRIVLAGDSTVTDGAGWGAGFRKTMRDTVEVVNLSEGSRSSKDFRDKGLWKQVLDAKATHVLIQFGHNDQPGKGPERETDPQTTFYANLARYIDEARAAGATPVLLTSLSRRRWNEDGIHIKSDLAAYADAAAAVAREKNAPLIDLHARSIEVYESLGPKGCELISPQKVGGDRSHLNVVGTEVFGPIIAWELRRVLPELKPHIRGYIESQDRAAATQPTTVPTPPELAERLAAAAENPTAKGKRTMTVAADGSGDFRTIQQAIAAAADNNADRTTIRIRSGVYTGPFVIPRAKQNITFAGDGPDKTILTYALNVTDPIPAGVPPKMGGNGTIVLADGFEARDLTFRNTSGDHGQAMALRVQGDRARVINCRLLGWQDTLLAHSKRQLYHDCYIEGRVDFIYGGATAVFENCEIHSKDGGYITAASTPAEQPFGFVFLHCKLTGEGEQAYLGRPWRDYAAVAFIGCEIGSHIKPEGWHNWSKPEREKTSRYVEYKNTGPGADRAQRVAWSKELTDEEAKRFTVEGVLGSWVSEK